MRAWRAWLAGPATIVLCLLAGAPGPSPGAALARSSGTSQGSRVPVSCHPTTYGSVPYLECVIETSGHVRFPEDIPVLEGNLSSDTPVTITAVGGRGGSDPSASLGRPGHRGEARTVVDYGALAHSGLYAYVGESGDTAHGRFSGGAATMALSTPLHHGLALRDVYVIAGGGGAQGLLYGRVFGDCGAGHGGNGHRADASHSLSPVSAPGGAGGQGSRIPGYCTFGGEPGRGGGDGVGGVQPEDSRLDGLDGIGGHGGGTSWIGVQGEVAESWMPGHGGVTSAHVQGGGGWGGGAAGTRGSGGGAGGSYAAAATASAPAATDYRTHSSVTIAFPQPKAELHVANRYGGHGTIDYYVDGKLVDTLSGGRRTVTVPAGYMVAVSDPRFVPNYGPALLARPAAGSRFAGWSGAATGAEAQVVTLHANGLTFTAGFLPTDAIAAADGPGRVTVRRPDGTVLCHEVTVCEAPHHAGEEVHVTATADPIADFSHFAGPCETIEVNHCTGRIAANELFIAAFKVPEVTLTIRVNPYGTLGTVQVGGDTVCGWSVGQWENCTARVPERGPTVRVHAGSAGIVPADFDHWSGACVGTNTTCTIDPARGSQSLTATFR